VARKHCCSRLGAAAWLAPRPHVDREQLAPWSALPSALPGEPFVALPSKPVVPLYFALVACVRLGSRPVAEQHQSLIGIVLSLHLSVISREHMTCEAADAD